MTTWTGQFVNIYNGKCLSAPLNGKKGDPMTTVDCDTVEPKQQIVVTDSRNTRPDPDTKHRLDTSFSNEGSTRIDTWSKTNTLYWSDQCGTGNDCDFHVWTVGEMDNEKGITSGPFQFWGWGGQGGNRLAVMDDGTIGSHMPYDYTDRSKWLTGDEAQTCQKYGVPLSKCTLNQIWPGLDGPECLQYEQWKRKNTCPLAADCKSVGVPLNAVDCTDPNVKLAKQCAAVDVQSCTPENLLARRQKCVAMELCLDNDCSLPFNGGCTLANIQAWEDKCKTVDVSPCRASAYNTKVISAGATAAAKAQAAANQKALDDLAAALKDSLDENTPAAPPTHASDDNTIIYVIVAIIIVILLVAGVVFL